MEDEWDGLKPTPGWMRQQIYFFTDIALLAAEIANCMYKKPIETMTKEIRYEPPADETRTFTIASCKRRGLLVAAVVEQMVPAVWDAQSLLSDAQTSPHRG